MDKQLFFAAALSGIFLLLFAIGEVLYHVVKLRVEITRKFVHLSTGLLTLSFPLLQLHQLTVLVLCMAFTLILLISLRFGLLRSINAIDRKSYGSLLFPFSVYLCYLLFKQGGYGMHVFYIPVSILAVSDPLAALVGKRWPFGKYRSVTGSKTFMGSSVFFVSAVFCCLFTFFMLDSSFRSGTSLLLVTLCVALVTTIAEALSGKGFDNASVPISALCLLMLLNEQVF